MTKTTKEKGFDVPAGFPIPLNKSLIIEKGQTPTKTKTGIIIPNSVEENNVGIVMAVANDCNPILRPGAKVMFNVMEDRTIIFEENTYLIMHEMSIFCVLPEEAYLIPEVTDPAIKHRNERLNEQQAYLNKQHVKELNNFDKMKETAKKKFGTHKKK